MLVDIPDAFLNTNFNWMSGTPPTPDHLAQGIYAHTWYFEDMLGEILLTSSPFEPWFDYKKNLDQDTRMKLLQQAIAEDWPHDFGVCDHYLQVMNRWPSVVMSPRLFVMSILVIRKEDQSPEGGWRWHKWGEYIGDKNPQAEYLYDEGPDIMEAHCFHLYELDPHVFAHGVDTATSV